MSAEALSPALSARLKAETHDQHLRMHALMERADPFASRAQFARFVAVQYLFQRDIEFLFEREDVRQAVPDLDSRGRQADSLQDLYDLGAAIPSEPVATTAITMPAALGWIYVSEGSTLGAAFLLKQAQTALGLDAQFGARNLAAYPDGRAASWRRFVGSLDHRDHPSSSHDAVIAGAHAAFDRFGDLLQRYFALA